MFPLWAIYKRDQLSRLIAKNMSFSPAKCEKGRPAFSILKDWKMYFLNLLLNYKELAKKIVSFPSSSWPTESKQQCRWDACALHSWLGCVKNRWPGHWSAMSLLVVFVIVPPGDTSFLNSCFSDFWEIILYPCLLCSWAGILGRTAGELTRNNHAEDDCSSEYHKSGTAGQ